ncbi:outer membrane protein [Bradyrhizobium sp. BWA-3-5]|uniref:outer membrane protein n=1 Tax=Bradyrhizobium sp. BWA-3-5 TaxID=3080013 RepID=UPI00293F65AD|nr:outer membrane beta-barrel protein [Bradyrhizobium sp. BWA-3-5]WOH67446.1 outer membrane beta-barrel protein [Bradyrhizobium sp. BWA-3-5]
MRSVKSFIAAGAATLLSSAAFAADMAIAPPPAYAPPPVVEDFGGWYLRGDIGFSNQSVKRLNNALDSTLLTQNQQLDFATAGIFGLGVGYQVNRWFRADVTGEYRGKSSFSGLDLNTFNFGGFVHNGSNKYTANKSELLFLANAYVDLGTWWCVTPFIGAGVGTSRVTISGFTDQGLSDAVVGFPATYGASPSAAYADKASKWNFAWAVYAGLAYQISPNVTLELAYRYVDLGDGVTGDVKTYQGGNLVNNPMTFKDITSHDLKLGVRWNLESPQVYAPPLIRKG